MSQYRVRPRAERDLIEHFAYIARDKVAPAERFLKAAEQCFERLAAMPQMGRAWESPHKALAGVRVCPMPAPYRSYLVFYRLDEKQAVEILAVLHGARDIGSVLGDIV